MMLTPIHSDVIPALQKLIRQADSHKGNYGYAGVIGGNVGMLGAALLAGRAALQLGTGKVWLGLLDARLYVDPLFPELMLDDAEKFANQQMSHLLVGPGLGQDEKAFSLLSQQLDINQPLILDADALNLIAQHPTLQQQLQSRVHLTLLTPHPAEAARLLGCKTQDVQAQRTQTIIQLSQKYNCHIALKGHQTLVFGPDNDAVYLNQTGNAALSSAGQGDVLGGIILALWAQGLSITEAACGGVYLHGLAADTWRRTQPQAIGLSASETSLLARNELNRILSHHE